MNKNVLTALVTILSVLCAGPAPAQEPSPEPSPESDSVWVFEGQWPNSQFQYADTGSHWHQKGKSGAFEKAWQDAEDDDDRDKVRKKVYKYLAGQFDSDMKRREKELEAVEARVRKLRKQLGKRVAKRDEIVELQLKQLTMSWDGLGWSAPTRPRTARGLGAFPSVQRPPLVRGVAPVAPLADLAPVPPVAPDMGEGNSFVPEADSASDSILDEIRAAASEGDLGELRTLASKLAEEAGDMAAVPANDAIWTVYEEVGDVVVDNKKFWLTLAKAAEKAADDAEGPRTLGNILDTAAHCYNLAGKVELALELQSAAVEASMEANDGEASEQIAEFLEELKELTSDDDEGDYGDEDEESSLR